MTLAAGSDPERLFMVGCGILKHEVTYLVQKNGWQVELEFFNSALHSHLGNLSRCLHHALCRHREDNTVVFYGACHPLMEQMLVEGHATRTQGQNCVDMLLGPDRFQAALAEGAFFLLEDWALRFRPIMEATFGANWEITREIFRDAHTHLLAIRTPCSGDFSEAAARAADDLHLPLRWMDADLDHLERVLSETLGARAGGAG